ncbi:Syntaxin 6 [Cinnamomum micranthum f. kanehirae]|uniref:Syntaxin 6 n=1 Tax=Cinnamomum micranthum f. kanehirae TaxID=337451 RepID=A0A3S3NKA0_9MAGN|nr:Syntaxin 6 [Cinnamomum micranthum f. kanehirae]
MASNLDQWEKDPFFSAAEEVQDSADRMESKYRRWIHVKGDAVDSSADDLRRELQTTLGTTKWQLEEFEQAVQSSYAGLSADEAKTRHRQFAVAIESQVSKIESSLRDAIIEDGQKELPWVQLDEGERDELAMFLIGSTTEGVQVGTGAGKGGQGRDLGLVMEEGKLESSKDLRHSDELGLHEKREEKGQGHMRSVSAGGDLCALKIVVANDGSRAHGVSSDGRKGLAFPRIASFSDFIKSMESTSQPKRSKNGFKKEKSRDCLKAMDMEPLQPHHLSQGINACFERTKTCLKTCDGSYDKQLYGWLGAFQRQIQRSQYQFQYSRAYHKMMFWVVLIIFLIVVLALSLKEL